MRMIPGNEQEKSQLANEIFDISNRPLASCIHLRRPYSNRRPFIDWYLILSVNENAELDVIRKQYHKLALQLHPDKNKHSKAETAFKLVSEAYFCLSDHSRRAAFDSDRKKNNISCTECNTCPYNNKINPPNYTSSKTRTPHQESSRFERVQRRINDLRTKLKEEAAIIEKCLVANSAASRTEFPNARTTRVELPVFNPADYQYKGYPHQRRISHNKLENLRANFIIGNRCINNSLEKNESPVFGFREGSGRTSFMSRSGSVRGP